MVNYSLLKIIKAIKRKIVSHVIFCNERNCITKAYNYFHVYGVRLIFIELPRRSKIKNLSDFEIDRITNWVFNFNNIEEELSRLKKIYGNDINPEYILSLYDGGIVVNGGNRRRLLDFTNEYVHIINGVRKTTGQPSVYRNSIFIHGSCTVRGTGVEDGQTIASFLQDKLNKAGFGNYYCVKNMGIGRGSSVFDDFEQMKEQNYKTGDIIIWLPFSKFILTLSSLPSVLKRKRGFYGYETSSLFNRPHDYGEWFTDDVLHTNKAGNMVIASFIFNKLKDAGLLDVKSNPGTKDQITAQTMFLTKGEKIYADNQELQAYLAVLKQYKRGEKNSKIGSIVMNCNPFTNGHKYLIEYAAGQVDYLYIFVVEENKSYFTFEDRFALVKSGVAHLDNVIVLPSGKFIISVLTFPGYFYKDDLKDVTIDCSNDIHVFAEHIAPVLNITIRFAGEEPLDPITRQYNQTMEDLLPRFGINFKVIQRKESGGSVISASRVRRCFENGRLEDIKAIVPLTTYAYLVARWEKEHCDKNRKEIKL